MLSQMDEDLVLACQHNLEEEDLKSGAEAERRRIAWERLEAAANVESVVDDILVPVKSAA
ncbi:hypothetical protein QN277_006968 [Acacia crassicarpa]|uniref:Uncharacterized protein n=1 Tax=Acacia crassicarpa TaxID=499986 RepID=A0AAE1IUE9_9FABA|nr:hypothetical protein QN277_006968 [Acacia crassicarpa]